MDRERFAALAPMGFTPTDDGPEWSLVVPGTIEILPGIELRGYSVVWDVTLSAN
jgi:hypothetical protein